jgi:single-strand DNA-binding protein
MKYYKENGDKVEKPSGTALQLGNTIIEKYVTKGKEVAIEGKVTHRSYDDKDE